MPKSRTSDAEESRKSTKAVNLLVSYKYSTNLISAMHGTTTNHYFLVIIIILHLKGRPCCNEPKADLPRGPQGKHRKHIEHAKQ